MGPGFPSLLSTGSNTEDTAGRKGRENGKRSKKGRQEGCGSHDPPWMAHISRLLATLDLVVVVILQDRDGYRVVTLHLQDSGLMAGRDIFYLKEATGMVRHRLGGWVAAVSLLLGEHE